MSKHTPGPWQRSGVRVKLGAEDCLRVGPDGFAIAFLPIGKRPNELAGAIADARLIAAAPELLDALQTFVDEYVAMINSGDCGFWDPETEDKVKAARAAIAKATGA